MNVNQTTSSANANKETVDLALELDHLAWWGTNNVVAKACDWVFPFLGSLVGFVLFVLNPLWLVSSAIFAVSGVGKLRRGDEDGARRALATARAVNWILVLVGVAAWSAGLPVKAARELARWQRTPRVQVVQAGAPADAAGAPARRSRRSSASSSSATGSRRSRAAR